MEIILECIEIVFAYLRSKLPCVFIFNEVTWFFPTNVYLRESINHAISYTWWWDTLGWMSFAHVFFHHGALYYIVLSFLSILCFIKEKQSRIFLRHSPFIRYYFFSFFWWFFFPAWVNTFARVISFEYMMYFLGWFILSFHFFLNFVSSIDLCMCIHKIALFLLFSNKHLIKQYNFKKKKKSITA